MASHAHTARSVLEKFYEAERVYMSTAPEDRDFSGIASTLSPDFRMEQTSALPYAGTYIGPQGMEDWVRRMAEYFSVVDVQGPEILERDGSDRIAVSSEVHLRVRKTGEDLKFPHCQVITVDLERGVMTSLYPFYWDVAAVNKALGYTPREA